MNHAELIRCLQTLPATQQAEVYDFVESLASRQAAAPVDAAGAGTLGHRGLPRQRVRVALEAV